VVPDIAGVYSLHAGVYYTKMAEGIAMGLAAALVLLLGVSFCVLPRFCKATAPEHRQVCYCERMPNSLCCRRYAFCRHACTQLQSSDAATCYASICLGFVERAQ